MFNPIQHIRDICRQKGVAISQLEKDCGFANGYLNAARTASLPYDRAYKISKYLDVPLHFLMTGEYAGESGEVMTHDAGDIAKQYDQLDEYGKSLIKAVANHEVLRVLSSLPPAVQESKEIPFFANSFAAGTGEPDFGNLWTTYRVPVDSGAEFAIRVNGDSMTPLLPDESIAFGVKREPRDGEVGAFLLNGEFLVKQYCADHVGNVYLFSLNRKRKDADRALIGDSTGDLYCFGTIMVKRQPLPQD